MVAPERLAMRKCNKALIDTLANQDIDSIADDLNTNNLIARDVYLKLGLSKIKKEKAREVVQNVAGKVNANPETTFVLFIKVLIENEQSDLAQMLEEEYVDSGGDRSTLLQAVQSKLKPAAAKLSQISMKQASSKQATSHIHLSHKVKKEELSVKNIKKFLKKHGFPASDADKLGEQLDEVTPADIKTIKKNHGSNDWDSILTDILQHWLLNDTRTSWAKLANALSECGHKVAANNILSEEESKQTEEVAFVQEPTPIGLPENEDNMKSFLRKREARPEREQEMPKNDSIDFHHSENKISTSYVVPVAVCVGLVVAMLLYLVLVRIF